MGRNPFFFERYYLIRNEYDYYTNFNISAKYSRQVLKETLSNALLNLVEKNPLFAVNFFRTSEQDIEEDAKNFVLRGLELIKFDDVVAFHEISNFDESTLEYIDMLIVHADEQNKPLWRVLVLEVEGTDEQYVTFYCNHALFDGTSGSLFHDKLLFELNEVEKTSSDIKFVEILHSLSDSFELPELNAPGVELYNSSLPFKLYEIVSRIILPGWIKNYFSSAYQKWYPDGFYIDPFKNPKYSYKPTRKGTPTKFKLLRFSPAEVSSMISRCKQNGLTLTPYTIAIALQCLQETIMKTTAQEIASSSQTEPIEHSSETAVSINNRRYLPIADANEVGLLVSYVEVFLPPFKPFTNLKDLYPAMKEASRQINVGLETKYGSKMIGLLRLGKVSDFLQEKLGQRSSRLTFDYSNLGNKNLGYGSWQADELIFSQSQGIAAHFGASLISTLKLGMNIVFGYLEEFTDFPEEMELFAKLYRERLLHEDA